MSTVPVYNGGGGKITFGTTSVTFDVDLESITPPGFSFNMIEATALGNVTCKTYVKGSTPDFTPCTLKVIMDAAKDYNTAFVANELITIVIGTAPDPVVPICKFWGCVTEFTPSEIVVNGKTTATIKISPTNLNGSAVVTKPTVS